MLLDSAVSKILPVTRIPLGHHSEFLYICEGVNTEQTRQRLIRELAQGRSLYFITNDRIRSEALRIFESTFAITYALQSIAIIIAGQAWSRR